MSSPEAVTAVLNNDSAALQRLLSADPALAPARFDAAKLYTTEIQHWIYVGDTLLHLAAAGHRASIVEPLLAAGADPNAAFNHRAGAPLHYAADGSVGHAAWNEAQQVKTIQLLLASGARLDAQDKNGATALHRAVRTRAASATECLLAAGADWKQHNHTGSTAFHLAVQNTGRGGSGTDDAKREQRRIIEMLLARGASPELLDGQGKSVLTAAKSAWIRDLLASGI